MLLRFLYAQGDDLASDYYGSGTHNLLLNPRMVSDTSVMGSIGVTGNADIEDTLPVNG